MNSAQKHIGNTVVGSDGMNNLSLVKDMVKER